MLNLNEVIRGLKEGKSYVRKINGGQETLKPVGYDYIEHVYVGDGFGGSAEIHISIIAPDRWAVNGWQEI